MTKCAPQSYVSLTFPCTVSLVVMHTAFCSMPVYKSRSHHSLFAHWQLSLCQTLIDSLVNRLLDIGINRQRFLLHGVLWSSWIILTLALLQDCCLLAAVLVISNVRMTHNLLPIGIALTPDLLVGRTALVRAVSPRPVLAILPGSN